MTKAGKGLLGVLVLVLTAASLAGCQDEPSPIVRHPLLVRTQIVEPSEVEKSVTVTGEIQPRLHADLSFRTSGRVIERLAEVGHHVQAGQVLARLDRTEQQADLEAATAAVAAAEAQLRVAKTNFERQNTLIGQGFTTRTAFDQAQEALHSAESRLETAQAQWGTARDALGHTELRAEAAGVITDRKIEIGQVVQPAQAAFALAQDGERDAVFDVPETVFFRNLDGRQIKLTLVANPNITATGHVSEVSPALDAKHSTVRVKVSIDTNSAAMPLGGAVAGTAKSRPLAQIALPWTALAASGAEPAVWVVDPATNTVSLRPVVISAYEERSILIASGLSPGDRVVVEGGKLLSPGQTVGFAEARS